jgi:hypothetical protein
MTNVFSDFPLFVHRIWKFAILYLTQLKALVTKTNMSYVKMLLLHVSTPIDHLHGSHLQRKDLIIFTLQGVHKFLVWLLLPSHRRSKSSVLNILFWCISLFFCITDKQKDAVQRNTSVSYHTLLHVSVRMKHTQAFIFTTINCRAYNYPISEISVIW